MSVDNDLYDRMAASWWDASGFLHVLAALNPARFGYMRRVLVEVLHLPPAGLRVLDVGCGGGLLAEEFARMGCTLTGVDPSAASLAAARAHAAARGLSIDYLRALGESLPFAGGSFDVAYCCDVLEHVSDVSRVVGETARVLRPGGVFFYDTINRTLQSRLIVIKLLQDWPWTAMMPPRLHDWRMFIRPEGAAARAGAPRPCAARADRTQAQSKRHSGSFARCAGAGGAASPMRRQSGRWTWVKAPIRRSPT